jgi:hypothetical protein
MPTYQETTHMTTNSSTLLERAAEYVERFADANEEPAGCDCRSLLAEIEAAVKEPAYPSPMAKGVADLLAFAKKQDADMCNDDQPGGAKVPTGNDWNDLHSEVMLLADIPAFAGISRPVFVATYDHKHGSDVSLYASAEAAEHARQDIAAQYWDQAGWKDPKPADPKELADRYFELCEQHGGGEWFSVIEREIEGAPPASADSSPVAPFLTVRELGTVLAALRYWKREGLMSSGAEQDLSTAGDTLPQMTAADIDALVERLSSSPAEPTCPRRLLLDISTAHLTPSSRDLLDSVSGDADAAFACGSTGFGWFTYASAENAADPDYPADLRAVWSKAIAMDCEYVQFDRDADALADLPVYED